MKRRCDVSPLPRLWALKLTSSRVQSIRYGQGWLHLEWRAISGAEADGWQQPEGTFWTLYTGVMADGQDQQLQQIVDKTIMEADKDG